MSCAKPSIPSAVPQIVYAFLKWMAPALQHDVRSLKQRFQHRSDSSGCIASAEQKFLQHLVVLLSL